jgi:hypothetical protein
MKNLQLQHGLRSRHPLNAVRKSPGACLDLLIYPARRQAKPLEQKQVTRQRHGAQGGENQKTTVPLPGQMHATALPHCFASPSLVIEIHFAMHTPSRPIAYLCLALSMSLVGSYVALSKPLAAIFPVMLLAWLRFGIGAVAMLGWLRPPAHETTLTRQTKWLLFFESFFGNFLFTLCMISGVALTSAVTAGVTMAAILAVAIMSWLFLREAVGAYMDSHCFRSGRHRAECLEQDRKQQPCRTSPARPGPVAADCRRAVRGRICRDRQKAHRQRKPQAHYGADQSLGVCAFHTRRALSGLAV